MSECAVYIRIVPGEYDNYIWIYRREGYWLVERGHNNNTRLSRFILRSDNELHEYLNLTDPAPLPTQS